jgi:hypothetical protein
MHYTKEQVIADLLREYAVHAKCLARLRIELDALGVTDPAAATAAAREEFKTLSKPRPQLVSVT